MHTSTQEHFMHILTGRKRIKIDKISKQYNCQANGQGLESTNPKARADIPTHEFARLDHIDCFSNCFFLYCTVRTRLIITLTLTHPSLLMFNTTKRQTYYYLSAIVGQVESIKLGGRSQHREAKLGGLSLRKCN